MTSTAVPTVTIYQQPELPPTAKKAQLTASTTNVQLNGLTGPALSARVEGSIEVRFYNETDFGPQPPHSRPVHVQVRSGAVRTIPNGALSVAIRRI
jgi:hypothetical protein